MREQSVGAAVARGELVRYYDWYKSEICRPTFFCLEWESSFSSILPFSAYALVHYLVRRQNRQVRKRILCVSSLHFRRRDRCVCFDRFVFLLRVSRARAHSHFSIDWNLGQRESGCGSVEDHNLSRDRKLHFANRFDPALSERSGCVT